MKHPRVWLKFRGDKVSVAQCAKAIGVSQTCLWQRLRRGASLAELFAPGYGPRKKRMAADMHTEDFQPARRPPPPRPYRELLAIIKQHGSPERAAAAFALSSEEYLKVSNQNLQH